ncbi:MAG: hypothetical protein AVDCRST_MAG16-2299, partial [uncultured Frankineae bacterium]
AGHDPSASLHRPSPTDRADRARPGRARGGPAPGSAGPRRRRVHADRHLRPAAGRRRGRPRRRLARPAHSVGGGRRCGLGARPLPGRDRRRSPRPAGLGAAGGRGPGLRRGQGTAPGRQLGRQHGPHRSGGRRRPPVGRRRRPLDLVPRAAARRGCRDAGGARRSRRRGAHRRCRRGPGAADGLQPGQHVDRGAHAVARPGSSRRLHRLGPARAHPRRDAVGGLLRPRPGAARRLGRLLVAHRRAGVPGVLRGLHLAV